jgi:hypothetical protein
MTNEIAMSMSFSAVKGGANVANSGSKNLDMAGTEMISAVQNFGTTEAAINLGGLDQAEVLTIKNLSAVDSLTVGYADPIVTVLSVIKPGGMILVSGVSTTLYAKASANTVDAFIGACET